ncbi:MAG: type II secretion system protein GspD [Phycisphaeraceae bacterium]|nr:type II secretion system protein GspD [Phycisphaeraceae bacterium]
MRITEHPRTTRRGLRILIAAASVGLYCSALLAQQDAADQAGEMIPVAPAPPPAQNPQPVANDHPAADGEVFRFSAFSEPVELTKLVDFVREELGVSILATDSGLSGQKVVLNAPITLPRAMVLPFLTQLLELKNYTMTRGIAGVYMIQPVAEAQAFVGADPFNTTQILSTGGLRPSSLGPALSAIGVTAATPGSQRPANATAASVAYVDELGLIVATGTPRQTMQVSQLVERLVAEQSAMQPMRFNLRYVAGSFAKDRVLELIGAGSGGLFKGARVAQNPNQQPPPGLAATGSSLLPFDERLSVDTQSNALYFRGRPDEITYLRELLLKVDVPNTLESRMYNAGRASRAIASEGQRQGLGEIIEEETRNPDPQAAALRQQFPQFGQATTTTAGPGFVIYPDIGSFAYRGTVEQHARVAKLVSDLSELVNSEAVVVEFYKLKHSKAPAVAEIIQNLLTNQLPSASNALLGTDVRRRDQTAPQQPQGNQTTTTTDFSGTGVAIAQPSEDVFVLADEANNQVLVKSPSRLQPQFGRLIGKLDLRRPQVYLDVKIVAVTAGDTFRLAFEYQLVTGQFAFNTNFGLSQFPDGSTFNQSKDVLTNLLGATAAYIRSDMVPVIINALASNTDTRILSSPQLLVDDNEEAKVESVDKQPYTSISQSAGNPQVTSFGGEVQAGTTLRIKPQISEGDYLKLDFAVELSNFTGESQAAGVPPPSQVNRIESKSVTVPSDTSIVVGGLSFEQQTNTVQKIPFLGDIPLIGFLFQDQRKNNRKITLYVFITPKIMKDPTFADLRLLTEGPAADSQLQIGLPPPQPVRSEIIEPVPTQPDTPGGPKGG